MIEVAMYVALGFLLASLIALLLSRPLWRRAVRLTTLRLESTLPMSRADMEAGKDELRAQYAIKLRNFELALEKEKAKSTRHLVDRNKSRAAAQSLSKTVAEIKAELAERDNHINVLEQNVQHTNGAATEPLRAAAPAIGGSHRTRPRAVTMADLTAQVDVDEGHAVRSEARANEPFPDENARLKTENEKLRKGIAELRGSAARDWELLKTEVTDLAEQILRGDAASSPPARSPRTRKAPKATLTRPLPRTAAKKPPPSPPVTSKPDKAAEAGTRGKLRSRLGSLAQRLEALTESDRS